MTTLKLPNLKEMETAESSLSSGHRLCAGCAEGTIVRQVLDAARFAEFNGKPNMSDPYPVVVGLATGCLEVATTPCPYTSWNVPAFHNAFENIGATMSGVVAAYQSLKKKGLPAIAKKDYRFVAFAGDGGTYDIGFQSLSGALERGTNFLYVCLNNEGYMNTGIQRSSATPFGAWTTTSNSGKVEWRKDMTSIIAAHNIPYVAQSAPFVTKPRDLYEKAGKSFAFEGPAFINVLSPCARGWRFPEENTIEIARLAVETCYWPIFEIAEGKWALTYKPKNKLPIADFLSSQGKFKAVLSDKDKIAYIQNRIDREWETLLAKCGA